MRSLSAQKGSDATQSCQVRHSHELFAPSFLLTMYAHPSLQAQSPRPSTRKTSPTPSSTPTRRLGRVSGAWAFVRPLLPSRPPTAQRADTLALIPTADDIAGAAVFFASDLSRYCTGSSLLVDGGLFVNLQ